MRNAVLDWPLWFLNTLYQCDTTWMSKLTQFTEPATINMMAAFAIKIVGRRWILPGISSQSENFLWTAPRLLKAVDLHWLWAHVLATGSGSKNLCDNRNLSRVVRFYLALSGMMPASYSWNHMLNSSVAPTIIYWTAYGCIEFCNLVAYSRTHASLTTVKSCFETMLLQNLQAQHFQESFS